MNLPACKKEMDKFSKGLLYQIIPNNSWSNVCYTYRISNKLAGSVYRIALNDKLPEELKEWLKTIEFAHIKLQHYAMHQSLDFRFSAPKIKAVYEKLKPLFDDPVQDVDNMYDIFEDYIFKMLRDWECLTKYFTEEEVRYLDTLYPEECIIDGKPVYHMLPQDVGYPPGLTANEYLLLILQNPEEWFMNQAQAQAKANQKNRQQNNGTQGGCNTNQDGSPSSGSPDEADMNHNKEDKKRPDKKQKKNQNNQQGQNGQQGQNNQNNQQNQNNQNGQQNQQPQQGMGSSQQNQDAANNTQSQDWKDGKSDSNGTSKNQDEKSNGGNGQGSNKEERDNKDSNNSEAGASGGGNNSESDNSADDKDGMSGDSSDDSGSENKENDSGGSSSGSDDGEPGTEENEQGAGGQSDSEEGEDDSGNGSDGSGSSEEGDESEDGSMGGGEQSEDDANDEASGGSDNGDGEGAESSDSDDVNENAHEPTKEELEEMIKNFVEQIVTDYQKMIETKAEQSAAQNNEFGGYSRGDRGSGSGKALADGCSNWVDFEGLEKEIKELLINRSITTSKRDLLYNYNRGRGCGDVLTPRYREETHYENVPMTVLLDVSGSISEKNILGFCNIFKNVSKMVDKKCTIVMWDEELRAIYDSKDDIKAISGGGTDIGEGIKYIKERMQPSDIGNLFVVSDCEDRLEDWNLRDFDTAYLVCWRDMDVIKHWSGNLYNEFCDQFEKILVKND